jgi:hypothetical protein
VDAVAPEVFDEIFRRVLVKFKMPCENGASEHLRKLCLERAGDLRPCYPRDMCQIIQAVKTYEEQPLGVSRADLERAAELFFGTMEAGHSN